MMILALLLSMSMSAFAAQGQGSITITNATEGDTYNLYKIFDATYGVKDGKEFVAYTIEEDNQFFEYLFGEDGDVENTYFTYNANTGAVIRREGYQDSTITNYLKEMVQQKDENKEYIFDYDVTITAQSATVKFENIDYGYYVIDKGNSAAVTINSNTPDVSVVDKTQVPGSGFEKWIYDEDAGQWVKSASSNIGDIVDFKVEFGATNYDGEHPVKYYTVNDTKGDALWVEFNGIKVTVQVPDGTDDKGNFVYDNPANDYVLNKGYYHLANQEIATAKQEWEYLGTWGTETDPDKADWYLIHRGLDNFDIVIPWMTNHDFTGTTNGFGLTYADNATSKFLSPVKVIVEYKASVEPTAHIGGGKHNIWNEAKLTWTSVNTNGPSDPSETNTTVYGLGLRKVDATTSEYLAGAEFKIYSDADCTKPVYVIPTNIKGVYILDDLNTNVSGENRETSREKYEAYLAAYLNGETQRNVVTTEENGKLVILGLEAGKYYLEETKAPNGYNVLNVPEEIEVGATNDSIFVIYDSEGKVYNKQSADVDGLMRQEYTATVTTVENSKGVELPSTGGLGTMRMITIGSVVALAFAVLLITHKKMSVYHD